MKRKMRMGVCVVSGGSNGIGAAVVSNFLRNGHKVYNLDTEKSDSGNFIYCDVSSYSDVISAFDKLQKQEQKIDNLVISAGIHFSGNVESTSVSDFDRVFSVNVKGAYLVLKNAIGFMKRDGGSIVLISSDQAFVGKKNSCAYNASKAAVASLARTTAIDYAPFNIRCTAVCPGTTDTPLYRKAIQQASITHDINPDLLHEEEKEYQLLKRIGKSSEVAELVTFLCSDKAGFITGSLHVIDGGYTSI